MKKLLSAILAVAAVVSACKKSETPGTPTVSFIEPSTSNGTVTLMLSVSNYSSTEAVSVPVEFEGTAVLGTDYTVSAEAFIVGGPAPVLAITITPVTFSNNKIIASISAPSGFTLGEKSQLEITLDAGSFGSMGRLTFDSAKADIFATGNIGILISTMDDTDDQWMDNDTYISVEVDTENSTAVLGEHFEFVGGQYAFVEGDNYEGSVKIKVLKCEEGKNTFTLRFNDSRFSNGTQASILVTIVDVYAKLDGEWVINDLIMDREAFSEINYLYGEEEFVEYPDFNSADKIRFDVAGNKFHPDFQSNFKRYFIGEANMEPGEAMTIDLTTDYFFGEQGTFLLVSLDNVNRYFSDTEFSEDKQGYIGVNITEDENGEELLDFYVIDYTSHTFITSALNFYNKEKPVATGVGFYIRMNFKRAN